MSENTDSEGITNLYNNFLNKVSSVQFDRSLSKDQRNIYLESYFVSVSTAKGPLSQGGIEKIIENAVATAINKPPH
jgi:hypothetical protein